MVLGPWLVIVVLVKLVVCDLCTDTCDAKWRQHSPGLPTTICGSDRQTHQFNFTSWNLDPCYLQCGVSMLYPGRCGCPNDCHSNFGWGQCLFVESAWSCHCAAGWHGNDCSVVGCPSNCTGHGTCVLGSQDRCACDSGFTANDCSVAVNTLAALPYGNVFEGTPYYNDLYEDDHPVFNLSALFSIRLQVDESDLAHLLDPPNLFNHSAVMANMTFENDVIQMSLNLVGLQLTGVTSRLSMKKDWLLEFDPFSNTSRTFYALQRLQLIGSHGEDAWLKSQLYAELQRAAVIPTQRLSFGMMWVNDILFGLYMAQEVIDTSFVWSRYGPATESSAPLPLPGNLYSFNQATLQYLSPNASFYQHDYYTNELGYSLPKFTQEFGDDRWDDLVGFLRFLDPASSGETVREDLLPSTFHLTDFFLSAAMESFLMDSNGYTANNNYMLLHLPPLPAAPDTPQWTLLRTDFQACLDQTSPYDSIFSWFDHTWGTAPLTAAVFSEDAANDTFIYLTNQLLAYTFGYYSPTGGEGSPLPILRYGELAAFLQPMVARDIFWQTSNGVGSQEFTSAAEQSMVFLGYRYQDVYNQTYIPEEEDEDTHSILSMTTKVIVVVSIIGFFCMAIAIHFWRNRDEESAMKTYFARVGTKYGSNDGDVTDTVKEAILLPDNGHHKPPVRPRSSSR